MRRAVGVVAGFSAVSCISRQDTRDLAMLNREMAEKRMRGSSIAFPIPEVHCRVPA